MDFINNAESSKGKNDLGVSSKTLRTRRNYSITDKDAKDGKMSEIFIEENLKNDLNEDYSKIAFRLGKVNELQDRSQNEIKSLQTGHSIETNVISIIFKIADLTEFYEREGELQTEQYKIYSPKNDKNILLKIFLTSKDASKDKISIKIQFEESSLKGLGFSDGNCRKNRKGANAKSRPELTPLSSSSCSSINSKTKLFVKLRIHNSTCHRFTKARAIECNVEDEVHIIDDFIDLEEMVYEKLSEPFILRMDIESFGKEDTKLVAKCNDYNGIINEGNTCYMSSIIQILFHLPLIRHLLFQRLFNYETKDSEVTMSLQRIFFALLSEQCPIRITDIFRVLKLDKRIQHDVHEIFVQLLDAVEKAIPHFSQYFIGQTEQKILDMHNDREYSKVNQDFYFLELPIQGSTNLIKSLEDFMSVSFLKGDNQYQDSSKKKHDAKITIGFKKLPNILFIQLKRFDFNPFTGAMKKVNTRLEYSLELNLNNYYQDKDAKYSLYGVIVHRGDHKFGHYFCYICSKDGIWRKFNDHKVTKVSVSDVLDNNFGGTKKEFHIGKDNSIIESEEESTESAYILFYVNDSQRDKIFIDFEKDHINEELRKYLESRRIKNEHSPIDFNAIKISSIYAADDYNKISNQRFERQERAERIEKEKMMRCAKEKEEVKEKETVQTSLNDYRELRKDNKLTIHHINDSKARLIGIGNGSKASAISLNKKYSKRDTLLPLNNNKLSSFSISSNPIATRTRASASNSSALSISEKIHEEKSKNKLFKSKVFINGTSLHYDIELNITKEKKQFMDFCQECFDKVQKQIEEERNADFTNFEVYLMNKNYILIRKLSTDENFQELLKGHFEQKFYIVFYYFNNPQINLTTTKFYIHLSKRNAGIETIEKQFFTLLDHNTSKHLFPLIVNYEPKKKMSEKKLQELLSKEIRDAFRIDQLDKNLSVWSITNKEEELFKDNFTIEKKLKKEKFEFDMFLLKDTSSVNTIRLIVEI